AVGYAAYRGAVTVAHEYGTAMSVLTELNRFSLYDRLQLQRPATLEDELHQNVDLMKAFGQQTDVSFRYVSAQGAGTSAAVSDAPTPTDAAGDAVADT